MEEQLTRSYKFQKISVLHTLFQYHLKKFEKIIFTTYLCSVGLNKDDDIHK